MLFNSYLFIFIFLPLVLIGWFSLNKIKKHKIAEIFLIGMSLWFYAYFNFYYLFIIVGSCLFNFFISYFINKVEKKECVSNIDYNYKSKKIKVLGILGIVVNLGILFYYKYYDFFIENVNFIFNKDYNLKHILLPLGISFFTFQQLSYVIDRMKGEAPHYGLIEYMSFVTFFPQLIAGPIVLHSELVPQFRDMEKRKFNTGNFTDGCVQAILGLGKKVLIADTLALVVNQAYYNRYYFTTWSALLFILTYIFELYFDFSGYCDIAMGVGKMFNYDIPRNFNYPYKATSMKEFWNRWHITLNRFFTTYVYIPLGGSRCSRSRNLLNIFIVWMLTGFWHGAEWTFVAWGLYFGILLILEKTILLKWLERIPVLGHVYILVLGMISFVIFDAVSIADAAEHIRAMFGGTGLPMLTDVTKYYLYSYGVIFVLAMIGATPLPKILFEKVNRNRFGSKMVSVIEPIAMVLLVAAATGYLVDGSFNPFLYFRF